MCNVRLFPRSILERRAEGSGMMALIIGFPASHMNYVFNPLHTRHTLAAGLYTSFCFLKYRAKRTNEKEALTLYRCV